MGVGPQGAGCRNCGTPLAGEYCFACGQRDLPLEPTLRELLAEAWDAFVSIDGKVFASLKLLLGRPGALTTEYLGGHRVRFLPPLRLYLVCSVVYFLVSASLPDTPPRSRAPAAPRPVADSEAVAAARTKDSTRRAVLRSIGRPAVAGPLDSASIALADSVDVERDIATELGPDAGLLKRAVIARFVRNGERVRREKRSFGRMMRDQVPRLMFVLMPLFALLLALSYRSRRRRYPAHLVVSLHLHAFAFAALTLGALVAALPVSPWRSNGLVLLSLWMFAYVPLALRRVYGGRLRAAVLRAATVEVVYFVVGVTAFTIGAVALVAFY